jgi:CubicO group peptidase (beta-lactamase class C family)
MLRMDSLQRALAKTYFGRYVLFNRPTNRDHARMPQRLLAPAPRPRALARAARTAPLDAFMVSHRPSNAMALPRLLTETGTTAFVVLSDGHVAWEHYGNGGRADRAERCFSVTKSVASALVGLAMGAGAIASLRSTLGTWLPQLRDARVRDLTLEHLLEMRSGIAFHEGVFPWRDEPRTYYATDMRTRLPGCRIVDPIGAFFHYNDWHPLLLTLVLERATGMTVTAWLQGELWSPLGAESAASMMVDRADAAGVEHLESGLTACAHDLAKFGQLYLQNGRWEGRQLLPAGWVESTTLASAEHPASDWFRYYRNRPWGRFLAGGRIEYGRFWWVHRIDRKRRDFFAMGVLGQHVYVSPDTRVVIVRLSERFPADMWWAPLLRRIAEAVATP